MDRKHVAGFQRTFCEERIPLPQRIYRRAVLVSDLVKRLARLHAVLNGLRGFGMVRGNIVNGRLSCRR